MIDPLDLPKYNMSDDWLEEFLAFCVCVAGKNAITTSRNLEKLRTGLIKEFGELSFFNLMRIAVDLPRLIKSAGLGCYNHRATTFGELVNANLDLKTCSSLDLEEIKGIGKKTSRFFLLHTRRDIKVACLDVHILKYLKDKGYSVPKQTPIGKKYDEIEKIFIEIASNSGYSIADFDLMIWKEYSGR